MTNIHYIYWRVGAGPASCWARDVQEATDIASLGDPSFPADLATLRPTTAEERDDRCNMVAAEYEAAYFRS